MKVIIIDDEPKAIHLLSSYLEYFDSIELIGTFRNGLKALDFLKENSVDLVLLDIQMPHISGLSISRIIDQSIKVIFTTAHPEFAVESYELNAVDYLLKPISLERFTVAIQKVIPSVSKEENTKQQTLFVKSGSKKFRIQTDDILYLQKDGNYMIYHLAGQKIMARETIAEALGNLPKNFIQVHKSFIVNTNAIGYLTKTEISIGPHLIPIGLSFKEETRKKLSI